MPFYTGKSKDGSDMQEIEGMYINPDNPNEWSNMPYPKQIKKKNIAIVGMGTIGHFLLEKAAKVIVNETKSFEPEPIIYNAIPKLKLTNQKEFVCKGRHEYREVKTKEGSIIKVEWICQCGRKTTD